MDVDRGSASLENETLRIFLEHQPLRRRAGVVAQQESCRGQSVCCSSEHGRHNSPSSFLAFDSVCPYNTNEEEARRGHLGPSVCDYATYTMRLEQTALCTGGPAINPPQPTRQRCHCLLSSLIDEDAAVTPLLHSSSTSNPQQTDQEAEVHKIQTLVLVFAL